MNSSIGVVTLLLAVSLLLETALLIRLLGRRSQPHRRSSSVTTDRVLGYVEGTMAPLERTGEFPIVL